MNYNSQASLILARLMEAPGEWVPMPELARVSGSWNIHSRIDQLRHEFGQQIQNELRRNKDNSRRKDSYYRIILPSDS
jgi:hypothetical protein